MSHVVDRNTSMETDAAEPESPRVLANRRNARRSTGPRTEEGKARSRRNALKHGLNAEIVHPEETDREIAERRASYLAKFAPADRHERDLVELFAAKMTQLFRAGRETELVMARASDAAAEDWDDIRRAETAALAARIAARPTEVAAKLRLTYHGADWLIARWAELGALLEQGTDWNETERNLALDLLGVPPTSRRGPTPVDPPDLRDAELRAYRLEIVGRHIHRLIRKSKRILREASAADRELVVRHPAVSEDPAVRRSLRNERLLAGRVFKLMALVERNVGLPEGDEPDDEEECDEPLPEPVRTSPIASRPEPAPLPRPTAPAPVPPPPPRAVHDGKGYARVNISVGVPTPEPDPTPAETPRPPESRPTTPPRRSKLPKRRNRRE